ncbi:monomeric sarcosine oxidase-like [Haliotis rufescens]|uniref:monomeric sarcosine oxidase-like n=1 Tax=Haliotis rufescens TaxID=6454 RepID=UPI00201E9CA5|nr:monomeric sarcosine oxidase-like [Haliotis rufescens]XP_046361733.2 monomeric sarcosine oxidase-like [Haliotis rufescens]
MFVSAYIVSSMADKTTPYFDTIVVGCGGIGSAAVFWLSKTSSSVLGLEQFELGHERGGSQDVSRVIRHGYHDETYSRLIPHAYSAWEDLERESGLNIIHKTGGLQLARRGEGDHVLQTYMAAMTRDNIKFDRLTNTELMRRFPQFNLASNVEGFHVKDSGIVDAALANAAHIQLARGNGATIIDRCPVTRLHRANNGNVVVHTTKGVFECRKVVVTAGGWLNSVVGTIGVYVPVTVTQEQVTYYATPHMKEFTKDRFPVWCFHGPRYDIYALPIHGNTGTKVGIDAGGHVVTADARTFDPDPVREKACSDLVDEICPKFAGPILSTKTCLYTMPPDRHFVVDTCAYKGWSDVIVCCGAGHAYKFASILGKILSELAVDGRTQYDISQFNITRDAIQDSTFKPTFFMGAGVEAKL